MCKLIYGPVRFKCGHEGEETGIMPHKSSCGVIKDRVPVAKSTKRTIICTDCKAKRKSWPDIATEKANGKENRGLASLLRERGRSIWWGAEVPTA
ncbi:hypothetical protein N7517_011631 [Penicillium concentricum]|uniref:Uncharacterized protein n=1 Tax=Penicillium concentricum TaxID=293559 RepID=A0A9W9RB95_9EURO|nr:uncharacterized protein N7517_011631 [Penicillium concentricum]KAJ5357022.1 hypothetical protein N7517_011631 [Penicillium concentricum]